MDAQPKGLSDKRKLTANIRPQRAITLVLDDGRTVTVISQKHRGRMRLYVPSGQGVAAIRGSGFDKPE